MKFYIQVNEHLCHLTGVKSNLTSAYHPQSNGHDERFNQTLQRQLLKFVHSEQDDWDLYIESILFSYRVARQDSTKCSPFVLVYGRQARLPIEFNTKPKEEYDDIEEDLEDKDAKQEWDLEQHITAMVGIRKKALQNIESTQKKQKAYYDAKHCKNKDKYKVETLVLLKNCRKLSQKGSKLEPNWTGPYCIHEVIGKGTFKLRHPNNCSKTLVSTYNMTRLKLYYEHGSTEEHAVLSANNGGLKVKDCKYKECIFIQQCMHS